MTDDWQLTLMGRYFTPDECEALGPDNMAMLELAAHQIDALSPAQRGHLRLFDEAHFCDGTVPTEVEARAGREWGHCATCGDWAWVIDGHLDKHGRATLMLVSNPPNNH